MNPVNQNVMSIGQPDVPSKASAAGGWLTEMARHRIFSILEGLSEVYLKVVQDGRQTVFGESSNSPELEATVWVHDPVFFKAIALRGSMGAGEAYMEGLWSCDDLTAVLQLFARNHNLLNSVDSGLGRSLVPIYRLLHRLRRNTRSGSRRNIAEHYDLSNDFFSLFLDERMMYSCAYFESDESTLGEASAAKIERICRKLKLGPQDHLIEIGSGWGGFAVYAASRFGCRVTTTTISEEQYWLAKERVCEAGLNRQVTVLLEDYRDLKGKFDKLVSIEMIEAVGRGFLGEYFRKCSDLIRGDGLGLIQAIVMSEEFYEDSKKSVDFIQRYIFPGSDIPSITGLKDALREASKLRLTETEDITHHYAETLRLWRLRFLDKLHDVRRMGFSDRFIRMWEFYFCYCEAGFRERHIGDIQLLLKKS